MTIMSHPAKHRRTQLSSIYSPEAHDRVSDGYNQTGFICVSDERSCIATRDIDEGFGLSWSDSNMVLCSNGCLVIIGSGEGKDSHLR